MLSDKCLGPMHLRILNFWKFWQGAHDAEILSLSFSLSSKKEANSEEATDSQSFLASGGRDRMINLYDVNRFDFTTFSHFYFVGCVC